MAFFVLMIGNLFGLENTAGKENLPESNKKETKGMKRSIDVSKRHFVNLTRINHKKQLVMRYWKVDMDLIQVVTS